MLGSAIGAVHRLDPYSQIVNPMVFNTSGKETLDLFSVFFESLAHEDPLARRQEREDLQ